MSSRITVVEQVIWQEEGEQPVSFTTRFSRSVGSKEQPYSRKLLIGPSWVKLDLGWVEDPGMLLIYNGSKVEVAIHLQGAGILIPPNDSLRIKPEDWATISFFSPVSETKVTVTIFPK